MSRRGEKYLNIGLGAVLTILVVPVLCFPLLLLLRGRGN